MECCNTTVPLDSQNCGLLLKATVPPISLCWKCSAHCCRMSSISKLELISQIKINLLLNLSENQEKKVFDPHGCKSTSAGTREWGEGCLAIAFACLPGTGYSPRAVGISEVCRSSLKYHVHWSYQVSLSSYISIKLFSERAM